MKKNLKKLGAVAITFVLVTVFSGCQLFGGEPDPDSTVREGMKNIYDVDSSSYELTVKGDMTNPNFEGGMDTVTFDVTLNGDADSSDPVSPRFTMMLNGSGSVNGETPMSVAAEMRMNENSMYVMLTEASNLGDDIPAELVDPFLNTWWEIPIPEGTFEEATLGLPTGGDDLTPEEQAVKDLFAETSFFKDLSYIGTENVMGADSYGFSGTWDADATKVFLEKAAEIQGQTLGARDLEDIDMLKENMDLNVEIWVGIDDLTMRKISGTVVITPPEEEEGSANIDFSFSMSDFGKSVDIVVPEETEIFDPMMFLGAMMMGGGMVADPGFDPTIEYDTDFDYDVDFDYEAGFDEDLMLDPRIQ